MLRSFLRNLGVVFSAICLIATGLVVGQAYQGNEFRLVRSQPATARNSDSDELTYVAPMSVDPAPIAETKSQLQVASENSFEMVAAVNTETNVSPIQSLPQGPPPVAINNIPEPAPISPMPTSQTEPLNAPRSPPPTEQTRLLNNPYSDPYDLTSLRSRLRHSAPPPLAVPFFSENSLIGELMDRLEQTRKSISEQEQSISKTKSLIRDRLREQHNRLVQLGIATGELKKQSTKDVTPTVDELMATMAEQRANKAQLTKAEQTIVEVIKRKLNDQAERLKQLEMEIE